MKRSFLALCIAAVAAGTADAATLVTPGVQVVETGRVLCSLLNTTARDIPVKRWELVFDDGRVLATFPGSTLRAGLTLKLDTNPSSVGVGGGIWHCRAEIAGSRKNVRLAICPVVGGSCTGTAPAP